MIGKPDLCGPVLDILSRLHQNYQLSFSLSAAALGQFTPDQTEQIRQSPYIFTEPADAVLTHCGYILSFGGDGTLLRTARLIGKRETPIIGVNFGKLGFLTEINPDELDFLVPQVLAGNQVIENRMVLQSVVSLPDQRPVPNGNFWAVNDVVIDKSGYSRLISIELRAGNSYLGSYRADGVIIATPAGSTGYSLASGGPIMHPALNSILITPICPHSLTVRPLVIPATETVNIIATTQFHKILVAADGQGQEYPFETIHITVERAQEQVRIVKNVRRTYFDVLRSKFLWTTDVRSTDTKE